MVLGALVIGGIWCFSNGPCKQQVSGITEQIAHVFDPPEQGGSNSKVVQKIKEGKIDKPEQKNVEGAVRQGLTPEQAVVASVPHDITNNDGSGPKPLGKSDYEDHCRESICILHPQSCPSCKNGHYVGFARASLAQITKHSGRMSYN